MHLLIETGYGWFRLPGFGHINRRGAIVKVFLSWSGQRSRAVAELLNEWIACVLQAARPWISTHDIGSGTVWFNEIQTQLSETSVGIVCLTQENKTKPWILFEAGALAKGISASRVCTFLIDLKHSDVEMPLAQFNHTSPERDSMRHLVQSLNACFSIENRLKESVLQSVFDVYWPQFEEAFASVIAGTADAAVAAAPRSQNDMLSEILETTRSMAVRVAKLENQQGAETKWKRARFEGPSIEAAGGLLGKVQRDAEDEIIARNADAAITHFEKRMSKDKLSTLTEEERNIFFDKLRMIARASK